MKFELIDGRVAEVLDFSSFGRSTRCQHIEIGGAPVMMLTNEFWTSRQRAANPLHEISYRACFKPQLPSFFIKRYTQAGDVIYDPFMGRGTTLLEAALRGRKPIGCDINPLSRILIEPRFTLPTLDEIEARLAEIDIDVDEVLEPEPLLAFYHPRTLGHISALRAYFIRRETDGEIDYVDQWIRMVATNRLTGHSPGFFSVYTMPPNQAVTAERQLVINAKRHQTPPIRDVKAIILKKSRALLRNVDRQTVEILSDLSAESQLLTGSCTQTPSIKSESVHLVVTSPPFLDVVDYRTDNWLRCWFNGIDSETIPIWQLRSPHDWIAAMSRVFIELERVLVPGGHVAFEVGEIRGGRVLMETLVVEAAAASGLEVDYIMVNQQAFTKTANCWGVSNRRKGTNTNRIVVLHKPDC
ncbi:MAG: DNA methyltransferase [Opitutaceae bacterium]